MWSYTFVTGEPSTTASQPYSARTDTVKNEELLQLLTSLGLDNYYHTFLEENITAENIWKLTNDDLTSMGITLEELKKFAEAKNMHEGIKSVVLLNMNVIKSIKATRNSENIH